MEEKETRPRLPPSHLSNLSMNASIGIKYKVYKVITPWNVGVSTKHTCCKIHRLTSRERKRGSTGETVDFP